MTFYADLHVHSKHSRATSREADLEHFALWAARKGLGVVATGDFTHPAWLQELEDKLAPAEPGLFRLKPELEAAVDAQLPPLLRSEARGPTRFILEVEISTIYKRDGRTRKVHHIVFAPDLEKAKALRAALSRIGNLNSDGRPILGLDSRDLLEITLDAGDGCFLIPAHIWTPWFSALGSMSGFDAIADCYADLAPQVFAAETGLSSDPPMNWRVSSLDGYRLVSNSDCHSPSKLAREACRFDTAPDYFAMKRALETGQGYGGTVEFFPEEGKYHLDGHRKCNQRLRPEETREHKGLCPACGKPLTIGVMNRVEALADRPDGVRPDGVAPFVSLIPLPEVLAGLLKSGPDSGKVTAAYEALLAALGPELPILGDLPTDEIARRGSPLLAEGIARMRRGDVTREAGYDGEYGVIGLFTADELAGGHGTGLLLDVPKAGRRKRPPEPSPSEDASAAAARPKTVKEPRLPYGSLSAVGLDPEQKAAVRALAGPLLIVAGPGTGKTRTLTHRIAALIERRAALPGQCLAITFTQRAAAEMRERLEKLLPDQAEKIPVLTFHGLGYRIIVENAARFGMPARVRVAAEAEAANLLVDRLGLPVRKAEEWLHAFSRRRHGYAGKPLDDHAAWAFEVYRAELRERGLVDFDDLILLPMELLEGDAALADGYRRRYPWISVDEYQDIDAAQYRLLRQLAPPNGNLCAIGDPDQAIYGFRGGDVGYSKRFAEDFPSARVIHLKRNYRSGRRIVKAALQMIAPGSLVPDRVLKAEADHDVKVVIHSAPSDKAEAEFVVRAIEQLIGGSSFHSLDSGRAEAEPQEDGLAFSDIAVLYRTEAQSDALAVALDRSGLPFHKRSHTALAKREAVRALLDAMAEQPPETPLLDRLNAARESHKAALKGTGIGRALRRVAEESRDFDEFRSRLAMGVDVDLLDPRAATLKLLTLHASKGLEFSVVFVIGCEDGILPLRWPGSDEPDVAEERRLLFVGMTRAKRRLYLSYARRRLLWGAVRDMDPSPFLNDIRRSLAHREHARHRRSAKPVPLQMSLF